MKSNPGCRKTIALYQDTTSVVPLLTAKSNKQAPEGLFSRPLQLLFLGLNGPVFGQENAFFKG
jgi:hypothetical protein